MILMPKSLFPLFSHQRSHFAHSSFTAQYRYDKQQHGLVSSGARSESMILNYATVYSSMKVRSRVPNSQVLRLSEIRYVRCQLRVWWPLKSLLLSPFKWLPRGHWQILFLIFYHSLGLVYLWTFRFERLRVIYRNKVGHGGGEGIKEERRTEGQRQRIKNKEKKDRKVGKSWFRSER